MNIGVDLGSREVMGIFETTVWCLKKFLTPIWLMLIMKTIRNCYLNKNKKTDTVGKREKR